MGLRKQEKHLELRIIMKISCFKLDAECLLGGKHFSYDIRSLAEYLCVYVFFTNEERTFLLRILNSLQCYFQLKVESVAEKLSQLWMYDHECFSDIDSKICSVGFPVLCFHIIAW